MHSRLLMAAAILLVAATGAAAEPERPHLAGRYDTEYPVIDYAGPATQNRVWRMRQRLESGELKFTWDAKFGYLKSLLAALEINADSQVLVYSRTSLQFEQITATAPRAIYFNEDTYVGYVQGSSLIEVASIDARKGAVFFALQNIEGRAATDMTREGGGCLSCHDTFSMMGGGVPRLMVLSAPVDDPAETRTHSSADETDDRTPLAERWGGWYVTGHTGSQAHFGNLPLREERDGQRLRELAGKRLNLDSVGKYLDASHWLTDKSDVVALLVLEHQAYLQNSMTRINYKVRTIMSREFPPAADGAEPPGAPRTWEDVSPADQKRLRQMMEPLVRALFLADAAPYAEPIKGSNGFAQRVAGLGPTDSKGRSLRELDLGTRLLKYRLSYLVYSPQFDALPQYALDYINGRIVEVLEGLDTTGIAAAMPAAERQAIAEILIDTKPTLAALLSKR